MPAEQPKKFLAFRQSYQKASSSTFRRISILLGLLLFIELLAASWKLLPELRDQFSLLRSAAPLKASPDNKMDALLKDVQLAPELPPVLPSEKKDSTADSETPLHTPQPTSAQGEFLPKIVPAANVPQPVPEDHVLRPAAVPGSIPVASPVPISTDDVGIPTGSTLGIISCKLIDTPSNDSPKGRTLRICMKARSKSLSAPNSPSPPIDVQAIKIHVYFYEKTSEKEITLTDSPIHSQWVKPPTDWTNSTPQILDVLYSGPVASPSPNIFYGYLVAIYYNNEIQDLRSDPGELSQTFPPPLFLTPEPK